MPYKLINPSIIQENLMGNTELIVQFIQLYQEQIPIDIKALKEAIASQVHTEIASKAHHIKPTMEYIGAYSLQEKFQQLEHAGKNGTEIAHITTLFAEVEDEINTLLQEISDYREQL